MAKLDVKEHKKLVLKNVIIEKHHNLAIDEIDQAIEKFHQKLKLLGAQIFGPLIVKTGGSQIHDDGSLTIDYELYVQAHDYKQYDKLYETREQLVCENCAYLRFEGSPEYLQYAYSKLELYFYENGLETNGDSYTVYVQTTPDCFIVDLFRPVASL